MNNQLDISIKNKNIKTQCFDSKISWGADRTPKVLLENVEGVENKNIQKACRSLREFQCK